MSAESKVPQWFSRSRLRRPVAMAAAAVTVAGLAAACGGSDSGDEEFTLTVAVFGEFGYEPLYDEFEKSHPGITIKQVNTQSEDHHRALATHLATNSGASDIEAVEETYINQFVNQPDKFVNLNDHGGAELAENWLPWKLAQGTSTDGKSLIGYGTDVGSLAICYRKDLFEQAGLPTDREAVSALWPSWADYLATGKKFAEAKLPGVSFFDAAGNVFNAIVAQSPVGYFDKDDQLALEDNDGIGLAWDITTQGITDGLSAKLAPFSPEWNTGFQKGTFATVTCPAWMMGYITEQAPDAAGKWDIAGVPGGGGNWGGSFLTVPKQGEHAKEAAELAAFLTNPEAQKKIFLDKGNLPSQPALYEDPDIANLTNDYFSGAPVGQIYAASAESLEGQYRAPKDGDVKTAVGNALTRIEEGQQTPDEAWEQAVKESEEIAKGS